MNPSCASWSATPRSQSERPKTSWIRRTTPALFLRSGYTIQVRIGTPPEGIATSTYSPWRGDFSSRPFAVSSDGGNGSPFGVAAAAAVPAAGEAGGGEGCVAQPTAKTMSTPRVAAVFTFTSGSEAAILEPPAACRTAQSDGESLPMTATGFGLFCFIGFLLPVPFLAWLDRPRRRRV